MKKHGQPTSADERRAWAETAGRELAEMHTTRAARAALRIFLLDVYRDAGNPEVVVDHILDRKDPAA